MKKIRHAKDSQILITEDTFDKIKTLAKQKKQTMKVVCEEALIKYIDCGGAR